MLKTEVWNVLVVNRDEIMKPLTKVEEFLERFDNFKDSEFRSLEIKSPTSMSITLATQDKNRDFDWITITLDFIDVSDALLVDGNKLQHIDLSDGVTILKNQDKFYFGIGVCSSVDSIKTSTLFIESSNLKYKEGSFNS